MRESQKVIQACIRKMNSEMSREPSSDKEDENSFGTEYASENPLGTVPDMKTKNARTGVYRRKVSTRSLQWPPADTTNRHDIYLSLEKWRPRAQDITHDQLVFAKAVAWASGSSSKQTARRTARAALLHAQRTTSEHLPLTCESALAYPEVERTITGWVENGLGSRAGAASALRVAAATINPLGGWSIGTTPTVHGRRGVAKPYNAQEQADYLRAAQTLSTKRRRAELTAIVCLTMGAGLTGSECSQACWEHVTVTDTGVTVTVPTRGRTVPVLTLYAPTLADLANEHSGRILKREHTNAVSDACAFARTHGMSGFEPWRATNTWRTHQLARVPVAVVVAGAGISGSHLAGLLKYVPTPTADQMMLLADGQL